jgi:uncharacterized protein YbbC (DUF1343 family)/CubicO group peptidase (beta-lactamase class C family)
MSDSNWKRLKVALRAALALCYLGSALHTAMSAEPTNVAGAAKKTYTFSKVDAAIEKSVADGTIPGAVLVIGHHGRVVHRAAFGSRSLEPTRERMTVDTIFDLASLTKCIATTTSVMQLLQDGRVRLNDPVATYLPEFAQNGKRDITVRDLLTHYSGLAPDLDLKAPWSGRDTAFQMAMQQRPTDPPGSRFVYSDINFETLGFLVEKVTGMSLADYATRHIFTPLGMHHTRFLPPEQWRPRIAPTEFDEEGQMLRGVVHDPTARRMGGAAGHAGLFSTADDLARFAQALLSGSTILSRLSVEKMSTPQQPSNASSLRGLGWDIDSPFSSNRGELLPVGSFGHTGFTGTSLWIDPVTDTYIVLLTNAVHPRGGKSVVSLRARVATATVDALSLSVSESQKLRLSRITGYNEASIASRRIVARNGDVRTGIDVLEADAFRELHANAEHPVRVGLVTNQTGVDVHATRTADILAHAPGVQLSAIFSPEHGIDGRLDQTDIDNGRDLATGVPVYSVYGDTEAKRRPTDEQLSNLDLVVFDIQDVGVRFYTYESTLGYFLEAAAKAGKEIVVLDRPNPVGGTMVQGPVADNNRQSFTDYWQTPVRHGMTMAELAKMFNAEKHIDAKLVVVPMEGWMRGDWFDSTGRLWINPSPNMRSLTESTLYPGIGMIESANISVGRGTDTPFEVLGAPWIDGPTLAQYLNAREIAGVRFVPIAFTPESSVYAHQKCGGIQITITERNALDSPEMGVEVAAALKTLYAGDFRLDLVDRLMLSKGSLEALTAGEDPRRIADDWRPALEDFAKVRAKYLIY